MMRITIDTNEEITELDQQILMMVLGGEVVLGVVEETEPSIGQKQAATVKEAKKAVAKTAAAKKEKAAPKPEPAAEEPVEEDDLIGEDEAGEEEVEMSAWSDEDLLELAVKRATGMVAGGEAAKVREALDAAGASRVRELNTENVREFFKALS